MHKYVMKRLLMLIPVILGVSFLVFFIMSLAPGDTARMILGDDAPIEAVEALREELGLNDPVMVRYAHYMLDLLHGDLGTSYKSSRPVFSEIAARFPATFRLSPLGSYRLRGNIPLRTALAWCWLCWAWLHPISGWG